MARELPYRTATSVEDLASFERILATCFAFPSEQTGPWIERLGLQHVRLLGTAESASPAALAIYEMGQWFGGKSVPCAGLAAVGVVPEMRSRGLAKRLMRECLTELAARGTALSCLHPSTLPLYRSVGYEVAGLRCEMRADCANMHAGRHDFSILPLSGIDDARLRACHAASAARGSGELDRPLALWRRVADHRGEARDGFGFFDKEGQLRGYVWFARRRPDTGLRHDLFVSDVVVLDAAVARAVGAFFHHQRSTARNVIWYGGTNDAFFGSLPDVGATLTLADPWMTRIVDVVRALEARGYRRGVAGEVHLELTDELLTANRGRFVLSVADGSGRVTRGGEGAVALDVRDLASIYSGYDAAENRARFGTVRGGGAELEKLSSFFAGPTPSLSDMF